MSDFISGIIGNIVAHYVILYLIPLITTLALLIYGRWKDKWTWPKIIFQGIVCLACIIYIQNNILPKSLYTESKIVFTKTDANKMYFNSPTNSNIVHWQQILCPYLIFKGNSVPDQILPSLAPAQTFHITFDRPTVYGTPKINAFGHDFPDYEFYAIGGRGNGELLGSILYVKGEIKAPMFEVIFPRPSTGQAK